jgi:hypothetical protein
MMLYVFLQHFDFHVVRFIGRRGASDFPEETLYLLMFLVRPVYFVFNVFRTSLLERGIEDFLLYSGVDCEGSPYLIEDVLFLLTLMPSMTVMLRRLFFPGRTFFSPLHGPPSTGQSRPVLPSF